MPDSTPTQKPIKKPEVLVVNSHDFGDNYPATIESAQRQLEERLLSYLELGWTYHGIISRNIGAVSRDYYVFYRL